METVETSITLPSVTVMIPAYNEQAWIEVTVSSILKSGFPCEVVVVDDGSTDRTPEILRKFGSAIRVVTHSINRGKGAAIVSGLKVASGEIVVFCDAHLLGLARHHLLSVVLPLVYGSARAVLGVASPEEVSFSLVRTVSPLMILTGQRAYYKSDLMPLLSEMEDLGYGIETYLFSRFPRDKTAVVLLPGLVHLVKKDTSSVVAASVAYLREVTEILDTLVKLSDIRSKESRRLAQIRQEISSAAAGVAYLREVTDILDTLVKITDIMPRESRRLAQIRQEISSLLSRYMGTGESKRSD